MTDFKSDVIARVSTLATEAGVKVSYIGTPKAGTARREIGPTLVVRSASTVDAAAETILAIHGALCKKTDLRYHIEKAEVQDRSGRKYLSLVLFVEDTRVDRPQMVGSRPADIDLKAAPKDKAFDKPAVIDGKGKP